jgi:hypothetical protein
MRLSIALHFFQAMRELRLASAQASRDVLLGTLASLFGAANVLIHVGHGSNRGTTLALSRYFLNITILNFTYSESVLF